MNDAKNLVEEHASLKQELSDSELEREAVNELLEEANTSIEEVKTLNENLHTKVADLEKQIAGYEQELEKTQSLNTDLEKQVESLTQEEASVEVKVVETCQELGVQPVSLTAEGDSVNYAAEFASISDPVAKTKFYREHKEKILGGIN